ncbi:MAG: hypothetical protein A2Y40_04710 [Candidatus Margulisbacteria bacterium GWF2_35_9]|nr:MAG: hypothetical protein A2Y40_04710 [Candidatus Margulisbacteria bacterium GWF2_35_9]
MTITNGIKAKIEELKKELKEVKGTATEVYTRIVGYYRPVQNWNKGKAEEYVDREAFNIHEQAIIDKKEDEIVKEEIDKLEKLDSSKNKFEIVVNDKGQVKKYRLFYSDNCPGCPPVKNYLRQIKLVGEEVNASTKEGFEEAVRHNITGTPTVLLLNAYGEVIDKAYTPSQIEQLIA